MERYLRIGASREVKRMLQCMNDLPGRADSKVAFHLLDRRVRLLEGGDEFLLAFPNLLTP